MARKLLILIAVLALALAACGGGGDNDSDADDSAGGTTAPPVSVAPPNADHGKELFLGTCAACHGTDGKGIEGLGKDFTTSTFAHGLTDEELVAFIMTGRPKDDPLNTTGVDMLPRGGNDDLTDQDLFDVVAYLRTLYVG